MPSGSSTSPRKKSKPRTPPLVHDESTYSNHGCRCVACTAAHTREQRRRRGERRAARLASEAAGRVHIVEGITHGESGYGYWGCRCETCRTVRNAESARRTRIARARRFDAEGQVPDAQR